VTQRPSTQENLKSVEEVTDVWLGQHGDLFLKRISEFCAENGGVAMDALPVVTKPAEEKLVTITFYSQKTVGMFVLNGLCR
jgi:hypothetical protein